MRALTKKQKTLLIKWYKEKEPTREGKILFGNTNPIRTIKDLTTEQIEKLEKINNTEILYQNINAFLWDLINGD